MKILDRYVIRNFLVGYVVAFCVLIGLRMIIDLFVNLDEFTEQSGIGAMEVAKNIAAFYGVNCTLYFRDFSGMIMVVAAVFSLGRMIRNNELVAIMASGVSLKRVIAPIVFLSILLIGLLAIDQELIIPSLSDKLVRGKDTLPGQEFYDVWFLTDEKGSLLCSQKFDVETSTLYNPTIIIRSRKPDSVVWDVTGRISAKKAVYNKKTGVWEFTEGLFVGINPNKGTVPITTYSSDLTARDIPIRRKSQYKTLLSSKQLAALARQKTKPKDLAQLYSQKHFRITDPIMNFVMLMISLPLLVCRNPKEMKSAILISFSLTGSCMMTMFVCKLLATEVVFARVLPELWAWLPIFIFLPIAFIELDSMKT